jgi:hypothetical protein
LIEFYQKVLPFLFYPCRLELEKKLRLFDSEILDQVQQKKLNELCEFASDQKWTLLYRATEHGFSGENFHAKCDNKRNTLTVIRSLNHYVFGGYTEQLWNPSNGYKTDNSAFVFSLMNRDKKAVKMKIQAPQQAIYCDVKYGPTFGFGHDIYISDNSNSNRYSYSDSGFSYKFPASYPRDTGSSKQKCFLAGSHNFQVTEIEVFQRLHI